MEPNFGWLSILPPALAISLALVTRQVVPSLFAGIWAGAVILSEGNLWRGTLDSLERIVTVLGVPWQAKVILFTLLMGSLLGLMQRSGGIEGFVTWVSRWKWAQSRRGAQLMAWTLGLGIFVESTITCLVVGTVARPLFDKLRISREKLAYLCDSTSAPVCILIPINGWGAMILGLLMAQFEAGHLGTMQVMPVFIGAILFNFYAFLAVALAFAIVFSGRDFGPMRCAEERASTTGKVLRDGAMPMVDWEVIGQGAKPGIQPAASFMLVPTVALLVLVLMGIAGTGIAGVASAGVQAPGWMEYLNHASGTDAVFWAVCGALLIAMVMGLCGRFTVGEVMDLVFRGAGGLLPLAVVMLLAFGIGNVCNALGTGPWLAEMSRPYLKAAWIAPLVFVVSGAMAFATGTSWGTFSIMIPLAVPLASGYLDESPLFLPMVISAVLGGGVFGDHASPISDTTIVSSMAASSDHIDHVRTQLPYALMAACAALVMYLVLGVILAG